MKEESPFFNYCYWMKILIYKEQGNKEFLNVVLNKAENYIKNQIKKYPKKATNYFDLAEIYCESGQKIEEAEKLAKKGFELKQDYYSHYVLGRVYLVKREDAKAVKEFRKALELNSSHIWIHYWLGKAYYYRINDKESARYYFMQGLKINPKFRLIKEELRKFERQ